MSEPLLPRVPADPAGAELRACRVGCGACCIAPSISSPTPKHPQGKPAGVACGHLTDDRRCELFGSPLRPKVCGSLQPSAEMCGESREQALFWLSELERQTGPTF